MKRVIILFLLAPAFAWGQRYQLALPQLTVDSVFFRQNARVEMAFDLDSASIHYTLDGTYPKDSSPVYTKPLLLQNSGIVRAKATHPDYIPGQQTTQQVIKVAAVPDSVRLLTAPDTLYPGNYTSTLFDLKKGTQNLKDGRWLGFRADTVVLETYFNKPFSCNILMISTLFDAAAWVFPPARIEVLGASGDKEWRPIGLWSAQDGGVRKDKPAKYELYQKVILRKTEVNRLQIRIIPYGPLPEWHAGAGQTAWLFLDEIVFQ